MDQPSDLPSHPEADDDGTDRRPTTSASPLTWVVVAIVAALIAALMILHLTGVVGPAR